MLGRQKEITLDEISATLMKNKNELDAGNITRQECVVRNDRLFCLIQSINKNPIRVLREPRFFPVPRLVK